MIVAYYRVSDDETGESRSPARQREQLLAYAATHYPALPVELVGDEGVSAYTETKRKGWLRVLKLLKTGHVSVLMATDLSRLHRRSRDAITFAEDWLVARGVNLVLLQERVDLSHAAGKLAYQVMVAANEFHRNVTSDKTRAAMQHKRAKGEWLGGTPPYGWQVGAAKLGVKVLVPHPEEQRVLRLMLTWRAQGLTAHGIAGQLTAAGILTKTGRPYWHRNTVADILAAHSD